MPAELEKDLFFLQPNNSKRRFQQYILSYVIGIEISLEGLNTEKIRILKNFVEEINSMLSAEVISPIRTQLHLLDPQIQTTVQGLLLWCCKSISLFKINPGNVTRDLILNDYIKRFYHSRQLWKNLTEITDSDLHDVKIESAKRIFRSLTLHENQQITQAAPATAGQLQNQSDLDELFASAGNSESAIPQPSNLADFEFLFQSENSSPPGYSSDSVS